mmetsp:Transcript_19248/g.73935  ORF Transcript_19248/g.73935 Transcript_19248/m.73935 type:complete len:554 (+) Transcript_19248:101-1762(+)
MDEYSLLDSVSPPQTKQKRKKTKEGRARNGSASHGRHDRHEENGSEEQEQQERSLQAVEHILHAEDQVDDDKSLLEEEAGEARQEQGQRGQGQARRPMPLEARDFGTHSHASDAERATQSELSMLQIGLGLTSSLEHKDDQEQLLMGSTFSQLPLSVPGEHHGGLPVGMDVGSHSKAPPRRTNDPSSSWHRRAPISKGTFSHHEDELLRMAVDAYCQRKGVDPSVGRPRLLGGHYDQTFRNAWHEIGACLPERTIESLYYRARRLLTPLKSGPWSPEEVAQLKQLHAEIGPKWSTIGQKLERSGTSVRDKFRELRPTNKGKWSKEELDRLQELIVQHKQNDHIPWTTIARQMGTRHHNQCRKKWAMAVKTAGTSVFSLSQDRGLITALLQQNVPRVEDVDWLQASIGLPWTSEQCKTRWTLLSAPLVEEEFSRQLLVMDESLENKLRHRSGRSEAAGFNPVKVANVGVPLEQELENASVPLPIADGESLGLGTKRQRSLDLVAPLSGGSSEGLSHLMPSDAKRRRVDGKKDDDDLQGTLGLMQEDPDDEMPLL